MKYHEINFVRLSWEEAGQTCALAEKEYNYAGYVREIYEKLGTLIKPSLSSACYGTLTEERTNCQFYE